MDLYSGEVDTTYKVASLKESKKLISSSIKVGTDLTILYLAPAFVVVDNAGTKLVIEKSLAKKIQVEKVF